MPPMTIQEYGGSIETSGSGASDDLMGAAPAPAPAAPAAPAADDLLGGMDLLDTGAAAAARRRP